MVEGTIHLIRIAVDFSAERGWWTGDRDGVFWMGSLLDEAGGDEE